MRFLFLAFVFIVFLQADDFNSGIDKFAMFPENFQKAFLKTTKQCFINHPEIAYKILELDDADTLTLKKITLLGEDLGIMLIAKCGKYNNRFFIDIFKTIGGFDDKQAKNNIMETFFAVWYVMAKAMKADGKL